MTEKKTQKQKKTVVLLQVNIIELQRLSFYGNTPKGSCSREGGV